MKKIFLVVILAFLMGCAAVTQDAGTTLARSNSIIIGMNKSNVMNMMGQEVTIGYEITNPETGATKPITVTNPQRVESITKGPQTFEVYYYFTHIYQADGVITDDELTPLVFRNDELVGKGWNYLNKIRP